jgi:hypothetical protein
VQLSDYCLPGADASFVEPFASRLLRLLEHFGGRVMIESGYRSTEQQQRLYDLYLAGGNLAAKPGSSNHERGLAADLDRYDSALSWGEVHYTAAAYGLKFPIPSEMWHCEHVADWVDPNPPQQEDDMTPQQLADSIGAKLVNGIIVVPLVNDDLSTFADYPLAAALTYTHQEMKTKRIRG